MINYQLSFGNLIPNSMALKTSHPPYLPLVVCLIFTLFSLETASTTEQICAAIPYNFITPCQINCPTCVDGSRNQCNSCASYLSHNTQTLTCDTPAGLVYIVDSFFQAEQISNASELGLFSNRNGLLTVQDVLMLCIANSYRFQVVGMFTADQILTYSKTYSKQMNGVSLGFRLFTTSSTVTVKIVVNDVISYQKSLARGSSLTLTESGSAPAMAVIDNDPSAYLDSLFTPIRTQMIDINSKFVSIQIWVSTSDATTTEFWGLSELSIVASQCNICVLQQTKQLMKVLGIVIGITSLLVILLVSALVVANIIRKKNYKKKMSKRVYAMLKDKIQPDRKDENFEKKFQKEEEPIKK